MLKKLFKNPGSKIKTVATVLFCLDVIAGVILAFTASRNGYDEIQAGLFFLFFLGVPLVSYVICLLMYGFGELVANSGEPADETSQGAKTAPQEAKTTKYDRPVQGADWRCDQCGAVNASYVSSCACGRSKRDAMNAK